MRTFVKMLTKAEEEVLEIMSPLDALAHPDITHELQVFKAYVKKGDWELVKKLVGYVIVVKGKEYFSFQDYMVKEHNYKPRYETNQV